MNDNDSQNVAVPEKAEPALKRTAKAVAAVPSSTNYNLWNNLLVDAAGRLVDAKTGEIYEGNIFQPSNIDDIDAERVERSARILHDRGLGYIIATWLAQCNLFIVFETQYKGKQEVGLLCGTCPDAGLLVTHTVLTCACGHKVDMYLSGDGDQCYMHRGKHKNLPYWDSENNHMDMGDMQFGHYMQTVNKIYLDEIVRRMY